MSTFDMSPENSSHWAISGASLYAQTGHCGLCDKKLKTIFTGGSVQNNDGSGGSCYYFPHQEEQYKNHLLHNSLQEAQQKLRAAEPVLKSAIWNLSQATEKNQKLIASYASQAIYDDRVLAEAIAFHKLRTEMRLAAEAATKSDSADELEKLQRIVSAAESVKRDSEAAIAAARAERAAHEEAKKEAARAAEREKWAREAGAAEDAARRVAEERAATEARRLAAISQAEQARLDKISLFAIRIGATDEEAEAVMAHLGYSKPGKCVFTNFIPGETYKENTMLAFQTINRFSAKNGLTQSQAEYVLRK